MSEATAALRLSGALFYKLFLKSLAILSGAKCPVCVGPLGTATSLGQCLCQSTTSTTSQAAPQKTNSPPGVVATDSTTKTIIPNTTSSRSPLRGAKALWLSDGLTLYHAFRQLYQLSLSETCAVRVLGPQKDALPKLIGNKNTKDSDDNKHSLVWCMPAPVEQLVLLLELPKDLTTAVIWKRAERQAQVALMQYRAFVLALFRHSRLQYCEERALYFLHRCNYDVDYAARLLQPLRVVSDRLQQDLVEQQSEDFCFVCGDGGSLLICDLCPKVYHEKCLKVKPPEGDQKFYCDRHYCSVCRMRIGTAWRTPMHNRRRAKYARACASCATAYCYVHDPLRPDLSGRKRGREKDEGMAQKKRALGGGAGDSDGDDDILSSYAAVSLEDLPRPTLTTPEAPVPANSPLNNFQCITCRSQKTESELSQQMRRSFLDALIERLRQWGYEAAGHVTKPQSSSDSSGDGEAKEDKQTTQDWIERLNIVLQHYGGLPHLLLNSNHCQSAGRLLGFAPAAHEP